MSSLNNTDPKDEKVEAIPPPTIVESIMGKLDFPYHQLEPSDIAALIENVLQLVKQQLKHLDGFAPFSEHTDLKSGFRDCGGDYHYRGTPPEVRKKFSFPEGIGSDTLCVQIADKCDFHSYGDPDSKHYWHWFVLLARNGTLFTWTEEFTSCQEANHGYRQHRIATVEEVQTTSCQLLNGKDELVFYEEKTNLLQNLLARIKTMAQATHLRRQTQLNSTLRLCSHMKDIGKRLNLSV